MARVTYRPKGNRSAQRARSRNTFAKGTRRNVAKAKRAAGG